MVGVAVVWGQGTVSCLTRVKSVRILAIMKREGLGGLELELCGCSARTERSRGVAGVSCCVMVAGQRVW